MRLIPSGKPNLILPLAIVLSVFLIGMVRVSAAKQGSPAYIDKDLFDSSVPSTMTIGQDSDVQVYVVDNSTADVAGLVVISYPQEFFFIDQPSNAFSLHPGQGQLFKFHLVPSSPHTGSMVISASLLSQGQSGIPQNYTISATVTSIQSSPLGVEIAGYLALGFLISAVIVLLWVISGQGRFLGRRVPIRGSRSNQRMRQSQRIPFVEIISLERLVFPNSSNQMWFRT